MRFYAYVFLLTLIACIDAQTIYKRCSGFSPCQGLPPNICLASDFSTSVSDLDLQSFDEPGTEGIGAWSITDDLECSGGKYLRQTGRVRDTSGTFDDPCLDVLGTVMLLTGVQTITSSPGFSGILELRALMKVNGDRRKGNIGVVFGVQDENNFYRYQMSESDNEETNCQQLVRRSAGQFQKLQALPGGWSNDTWMELRVRQFFDQATVGVQIDIYPGYGGVGAKTSFQAPLTNYTGEIGLWCSNLDGCVFDDVILFDATFGDQLHGATDCYMCGNSLFQNWQQPVFLEHWCRCCGDGGVGCGSPHFDAQQCGSGPLCNPAYCAVDYCIAGYLPTPLPTSLQTAMPTPRPTTLAPTQFPTPRPTAFPVASFPTPKPTHAGVECMTGHANIDFSKNTYDPNGNLCWRNTYGINDYGGAPDVSIPTAVKNGCGSCVYSGWDIRKGYVKFEDVRDLLTVGIDCWGVCGDADGDGTQFTSSGLASLGGADNLFIAKGESIAVLMDIDNTVGEFFPVPLNVDTEDLEGLKWDIILGVPASQPDSREDFPCTKNYNPDDDDYLGQAACLGVYRYFDRSDLAYPLDRFKEQIFLGSGPWPVIDHNPQPGIQKPSIEWTIMRWSDLRALFGGFFYSCNREPWQMSMQFFMGSRDDAGIDNDFAPSYRDIAVINFAKLEPDCEFTLPPPTPPPTNFPSARPTQFPSPPPSAQPSPLPSAQPTYMPTPQPTPQQCSLNAELNQCKVGQWSAFSACEPACVISSATPQYRTRVRVIEQLPCPSNLPCPNDGLGLEDREQCTPVLCDSENRCEGLCTGCTVGKVTASTQWCKCCAAQDLYREIYKNNPCSYDAGQSGCPGTVFQFQGCVNDGFCTKNYSAGHPYAGMLYCEQRGYCKVDCQVSEWSAKSICSASCGIGQTKRVRVVLKYPQNGGAPCPNLELYEQCDAGPCETPAPTAHPTLAPTDLPSSAPTASPSMLPSTSPSPAPTIVTPRPTPLPPAASECFSGVAASDFGVGSACGSNITDVKVTDAAGDVLSPSTALGKGWDIVALWFRYSAEHDELSIGIECNGICGDADGDGDPASSSPALLGINGSDVADLGASETFIVLLDFNNDVPAAFEGAEASSVGFDVALAIPSGVHSDGGGEFACNMPAPYQPEYTMHLCADLYVVDGNFSSDDTSFARTVSPKLLNGNPWPLVNRNSDPQSARPSLEFSISRLTSLRAGAGAFFTECNLEKWSMRVHAFAGSLADTTQIGNDYVPAALRSALVTFESAAYDPQDPCAPPPTPEPSSLPTTSPSVSPTRPPSPLPTKLPTLEPTASPLQSPTPSPTPEPIYWDPCRNLLATQCWATDFSTFKGSDFSAVQDPLATSGSLSWLITNEVLEQNAVVDDPETSDYCDKSVGTMMLFTPRKTQLTQGVPIEFRGKVRMTHQNGSIGIVFGYESVSNHFRFTLGQFCKTLSQRVNGDFVDLKSYTNGGWTVDEWYEMRVSMGTAGKIIVTLQPQANVGTSVNKLSFEYSDEAFSQEAVLAGDVGFYCSRSSGCEFDDVIVVHAAAADGLWGPLDCQGCNNPLLFWAPNSEAWCRCCGAGGVGCRGWSRTQCIAEQMCAPLCLLSAPQYCQYPPFVGPAPPPTLKPTDTPTTEPTALPTRVPTQFPTPDPTRQPTPYPTNPTPYPTGPPIPTPSPSKNPTLLPSPSPSATPSRNPTLMPTAMPLSAQETAAPTEAPTAVPATAQPTSSPTPPPVLGPCSAQEPLGECASAQEGCIEGVCTLLSAQGPAFDVRIENTTIELFKWEKFKYPLAAAWGVSVNRLKYIVARDGSVILTVQMLEANVTDAPKCQWRSAIDQPKLSYSELNITQVEPLQGAEICPEDEVAATSSSTAASTSSSGASDTTSSTSVLGSTTAQSSSTVADPPEAIEEPEGLSDEALYAIIAAAVVVCLLLLLGIFCFFKRRARKETKRDSMRVTGRSDAEQLETKNREPRQQTRVDRAKARAAHAAAADDSSSGEESGASKPERQHSGRRGRGRKGKKGRNADNDGEPGTTYIELHQIPNLPDDESTVSAQKSPHRSPRKGKSKRKKQHSEETLPSIKKAMSEDDGITQGFVQEIVFDDYDTPVAIEVGGEEPVNDMPTTTFTASAVELVKVAPTSSAKKKKKKPTHASAAELSPRRHKSRHHRKVSSSSSSSESSSEDDRPARQDTYATKSKIQQIQWLDDME